MKFTYRVAQTKNVFTVLAPDHKNVKLYNLFRNTKLDFCDHFALKEEISFIIKQAQALFTHDTFSHKPKCCV
jgi:hypothetical protein